MQISLSQRKTAVSDNTVGNYQKTNEVSPNLDDLLENVVPDKFAELSDKLLNR